jgi:hypothetical protein
MNPFDSTLTALSIEITAIGQILKAMGDSENLNCGVGLNKLGDDLVNVATALDELQMILNRGE